MINIIITSYNEPNSTKRAINAFLNQKIKEKFKIIVVDPFPQTEHFIKKEIKNKKVEFFLDHGEGKSYALNLILEMFYSKSKNDIFIFTDGDVFVSDNALTKIIQVFKDEKIGCVTAKPVSLDSRNIKLGYWSHFLFAGIDKVRKKLSDKEKLFECSGYLFAIRNGIISSFPLETSEDSIIPYLFWKKDYKIKYLPEVEVYVKNPDNWKDWLNQKIRNIKGHENLNKIAPDMPRTKSFFNELKEGVTFFFIFPKNLKEFYWTIQLYFARLYIYIQAFNELRKKQTYQDGWREVETKSTRTLD